MSTAHAATDLESPPVLVTLRGTKHGLEAHIEDPDKSEIFKKYPNFTKNHHATSLLADTLKVLLTGAVEDHHLSEILDLDLEQ